VVKQKTSWKTLAGLGTAAAVWLTFSKDFPVVTGLIGPPYEEPGEPPKACGKTWVEIQTILNEIEIDWKAGKLTIDQYLERRDKWTTCRLELVRIKTA